MLPENKNGIKRRTKVEKIFQKSSDKRANRDSFIESASGSIQRVTHSLPQSTTCPEQSEYIYRVNVAAVTECRDVEEKDEKDVRVEEEASSCAPNSSLPPFAERRPPHKL